MASFPSSSTSDQIPVSKTTNNNQTLPKTESKAVDGGGKPDIRMRFENGNLIISLAENGKPDVGMSYELDTAENVQKFEKYHSNYTRRLNAKYFSGKTITGGNIFEKEVTIENVTIKASKWPCTSSFTNPIQSFEDHKMKSSQSLSIGKKCSS
ncbi:hypothetical protein ACHQM5_018300 [Ranunculus cassubicifolius]